MMKMTPTITSATATTASPRAGFLGAQGPSWLVMRAFRSGVVQQIDALELLSLQHFQGCAAAGRDVGHLVGQAELLDGRGGVAAADDAGGAAGGRVGDGLGDLARPDREGGPLKDAHGTVPDDGPGLGKGHRKPALSL